MNLPIKTNSIIFIDSQLDNYKDLIAGVNSNNKVIILNSITDGIEQISQELKTKKYQEIHLIAHGSPGCIYLGNSQLNLNNLPDYQSYLHDWFLSSANLPVPSSPRLLIYGCNVAAGDAGAEFIEQLKAITGAEIAATQTLTGNPNRGGNWQLETTTTKMKLELAIAAPVREAYQGVLAQFVVTTADDEADGDTDGNDLSLREAIIAANNSAGEDIIIFDSSINQIDLTLGTLSITDQLIINGLGANSLTIDGGNQDFAVITIGDENSAPTFNVTIDSVTITGGNNAESGGGIRNLGNLTINNSVVSGNTSANDGGGIFNLFGTMIAENTLISDNSAEYGGGVSNYFGTSTLTNSTISGNTAVNGGGIYNYAGVSATIYSRIEDNTAQTGGGISNYSGVVAVVTSVISGNSASSNGGGLYNEEGEASVTLSYVRDNVAGELGGGIATQNAQSSTVITSSIISGNTADFGGGVSNYEGNVTVTASTLSTNNANVEGGGFSNYFGTSNITNSTISGNTAVGGGGVSNFNGQTTILSSTIANNSANYGSGIINYYAQTILGSTIVAANNNASDLSGIFFSSAGNNLIGDRGDVDTFIDGENNDLVGTSENPIDPLLGELQDNGGLTPTQALLKGSPAIDAGVDFGGGIDQRGGDFIRPIGAASDIGAFEVQDPVATAGDDTLIGSAVDNVISAREGDDLILGLDGFDILNGDEGNDIIRGGAGGDRITGGAGNDFLIGNSGDDTINGSDGNDTIAGGVGEDRINGNQGDDSISGGIDRDTLIGNQGQDTIKGGSGDDVINGNKDNDFLSGNDGNDSISGGLDRDTLIGGNGNDVLTGNEGRDRLVGGNGNDFLDGGSGKDTLVGGDGEDIFFLYSDSGRDIIVDFTNGSDRFSLGEGLSFGSLRIRNNASNSAAIIRDINSKDVLAVVRGVDAVDLTVEDFI